MGATDSADLQRAIEAAAKLRIPVFLGCRTYRLASAIIVPSHTTILGAGTQSRLEFSWSDQFGPKSGGAAFLISTHASNVKLQSFTMDGPTSGLPSGPTRLHPRGIASGVKLVVVSNFVIRDLRITNTPAMGINYSNSSNGMITHNHLSHTGRDGITGLYQSFPRAANITVAHNKIEYAGDDAIAINGAASPNGTPGIGRPGQFTIENNQINGWQDAPNDMLLGRGILVSSSTNVVVRSNTISYTPGNGILVVYDNVYHTEGTGLPAYSQFVILDGNVITNAGQSGGAVRTNDNTDLRAGIQILGGANIVTLRNRISASYGESMLSSKCLNCRLD